MSGLLQSGGGEDVDDLAFGRDRLRDELPDGVIELLGRLAFAALFGERGFDGLEEADVVADLDRFIAAGAEGEGLRELGDDLDEAFLAVFLLQDVLLRRREAAPASRLACRSSTSTSRSRASCRRRFRASPA